ncbi:LOW QUALITY PROTEIN: 3-oxo-5alpha-steroid 4-dehydrogenase [Desulfitobacterium sp. LBE]|nr:LOW QUALITY PROTEIN: 3-oxo-5alpha-steroid 4-dehydrogenase [Desulfitobacterium sp. LBE]
MTTSNNSKGISRKDFIKGAAFGIAGIATMGLAGCSTDAAKNNPPAPAPAEGIAWDHETDVVVVGFGGSGGAAAWEAGNAGSEVIILELAKGAGGSTNICGGLVTIGGGNALQKAAGFEDSPENFYNYLTAALGTGADEEQCRIFAEQSPAMYTWLTEKIGVKFNPGVNPLWPDTPNPTAGLTCTGDEYHMDYAAVSKAVHRTGWVDSETRPGGRDGSGFFQPLLRAVEALPQVKIMYETAGEQLIYDHDQKRVLGIKAKQGDKTLSIKARKAVVLTAGGFAKNEDMVRTYCPAFNGVLALGTAGDNGAGIKMGQLCKTCIWLSPPVRPMPTPQEGCAGGPLSQGIIVNQFGSRYVAEDHYHSWIAEYMLQNHQPQKHLPSYLLFDAQMYDTLPEKSKESLEKAKVTKANSIEELAKALSTSEGVLENTVQFYNSKAAEGKDPLLNKQSKFIKPIATAPFYALEIVPTSMFTVGGLRINTKAQVLSAETGAPITGLYSAGRNAANVIAQQYGGSGTSVATCFVFGRIAGQNAAAEAAI